MKRVFLMFVLFLLALVSWNAQSYAVMEGPPYDSWCYAYYCDGQSQYPIEDEGSKWANVWGDTGEATSQAQGWVLGARASADVGPGPDQTYYAEYGATASFGQLFKVTQAGEASVTFSWEGSMEIIPSLDYSPIGDGWGQVSFSLEFYDDFGHGMSVSDFLNLEYAPYSEEFSDWYTFTYDFTQNDVGTVFSISADLETHLVADFEGPDQGDDYYVSFVSDFMDTLELTQVSGGIAPVPIPGAVWLFGSGLLGLVVIRRRKEGQR